MNNKIILILVLHYIFIYFGIILFYILSTTNLCVWIRILKLILILLCLFQPLKIQVKEVNKSLFIFSLWKLHLLALVRFGNGRKFVDIVNFMAYIKEFVFIPSPEISPFTLIFNFYFLLVKEKLSK